jgi:hypothetical protein
LPRLSSWPAFHRYHHARAGRRPPEVWHREPSNTIHNALCHSQWNTWQPGIRPKTSCPLSFGIPSNSFCLSIHSRRSRHHISLSVVYPFRNPPLQLDLAISGFLTGIRHFWSQALASSSSLPHYMVFLSEIEEFRTIDHLPKGLYRFGKAKSLLQSDQYRAYRSGREFM